MHILKIIHGYPPAYNAGSEIYTQSICEELKKTHQVTVFTREENPYLPDFHIRNETKDGINFCFANMAGKQKNAFIILEYVANVRKF